MYESFRRRSCVTPRMDRKPPFVIVHTLLSLMICLCLACATTGQEAGAPCPAIEMSEVADRQTDSTKTVTLNDTSTILISRTPLVATGDITGATASRSGDQWAFNFTVTDDAAKRVHEFTGQHVGRHMALIIDGKVHGTPRIAGAVVGNYRIDGLDRADAERMATAISNGCRR
jgi:preprotein translocase subunit SecD